MPFHHSDLSNGQPNAEQSHLNDEKNVKGMVTQLSSLSKTNFL